MKRFKRILSVLLVLCLLCSFAFAVGYDRKPATEGLSFSVPDGAYLSIVGEIGAGKSTTMKTLLGLLRPIDGKIVFGDGLLPNEIGYLPQQTVIKVKELL